MQRNSSENQGRVVALDPGVRKFMTMFSETSFGWLGNHDIGRIQRLCYYGQLLGKKLLTQNVTYLDNLISRATKVKAKKRYRMRKAADKIIFKIRKIVDELHH